MVYKPQQSDVQKKPENKQDSTTEKLQESTQKIEDHKSQQQAESQRKDGQAKNLAPVELKNTDGSNVALNDKGQVSKVVEKNGKTREFGYDANGKINSFKDETGTWNSKDGKTWTNEKGETKKFEISVTKSGTTQIKEFEGRVIYRTAAGTEKIIEPSGRITENGKETQPAFSQEKLDRLGKSLDAIAYACNGGTGIGTDLRTIEAELGDKNEAELLVMKRMWRERAAKHQKNYDTPTLEDEMRDELSGADLDRVFNTLNKRDGVADSAGRIHTAIGERGQLIFGRKNAVCEKDIRDTLSKSTAAQVEEMDQDYRQRYGISLREAIMKDKNVSQATKDAVDIYLKGNDKRTNDDYLKLADSACKNHNIDMFQESMRTAPQQVRDQFMRDNGAERILHSFGSFDQDTASWRETDNSRHALDYARIGKESTANKVRDNTSMTGDNEEAIKKALKDMTAEERRLYLQGKKLSTGEGDIDVSKMSDADKKKATDYYKDLHGALDGAANATEMREWEALIKYNGKADYISNLASQKNWIGWHNVDDIIGTIEKMPKEDWDRLHKETAQGKHTYRDEIVKTLGSYLSEKDLKRCTDVLDKKIASKDFEESQKLGKRDALTSMNDARGWFNTNEENLLNAIRTMTPAEQERYRTDEAYRKEIDKNVARGLEPGAELEAGLYMLNRIKNHQSPDTLTAKLLIHAQKTNTDEAQVTREVEDALKNDPELRRKITNPQTEEERKLSREVNDALRKALGPLDYDRYGVELLKSGKLSVEKRQELNTGLFDDDEQGCYKDLLRATPEERHRLLTDKNYSVQTLSHLSEAEREIALNNLREFDRIANDKKLTEQQRKAAMDSMLAGEMRPEDKLRSYMVGVGTNDDGIKEVLKDLSPEEAKRVREDYERKYHSSLLADFSDEMGGTELENALDKVRTRASQDEEFDYYRDHFYYNTRGFGRDFVDAAWDGTGYQSDEAFNRYFNAISESNRQNLKLTPEQEHELQESLKEAAENLQKSKADLANTCADIAITLGAFIPGGQAAALLRFARMAVIMGGGGGITKVLLKAALLGDGYTMSNAGLDFCAGFADASLNMVGGGQVGRLLRVGDKAACKAATKSFEELTEKGLIRAGKMTKVALEESGEKLVSKEVLSASRNITSDAIVQGQKHFDEQALKTAAKQLVNPEIAEKATKEALARGLTKELAEQEGKKALAKAEEQIVKVFETNLKENLKLETRVFARRLLSDVGANTFNGASGAAVSGAISSIAQWDSTKTLEENFQMVMTAAGTSAITGGITGCGMSSLMKVGINHLENRAAAKAATHAPHEVHGPQYAPPINAKNPAIEAQQIAPRANEHAPAGSLDRNHLQPKRDFQIRNNGEKVLVNGQEWQWVQYDEQTGAAILRRPQRDHYVKVETQLDPKTVRPINIEGRQFVADSYGAIWQDQGQGFYRRVFKYQLANANDVRTPSIFADAINDLRDWGTGRRNMVEVPVQPVDMYGNAGIRITGQGLPAEGVRFPLNEANSLPIGRENLGSAFDNANSNVSYHHLKVSWDPKEQLYYLTDHSTNGTYIKRFGESNFTHYQGTDRLYIGPKDEIRLARVDGPQLKLDMPQAEMFARHSNVPQNLDAQVLIGGKQVSAFHNDVFMLGRNFQDLGQSDALGRQVAHYHGHIVWNDLRQTYEFQDLSIRRPGEVRARKGATILRDDYSSGNGSYLIRDGREYLIQKDSQFGSRVDLQDGDRIRLGSPEGPEVKIVLSRNGQDLGDGRVRFVRADGTTAIKRPDGTIKIDNPMSGSRIEDSTGRVLESTDIYGRMQRFHYDKEGRLNAVVSDNGSVLATKDGVNWTQTHRNGDTVRFGKQTFTVEPDGSLKMHDYVLNESQIYRLDGSTEIVNARGRVNYTKINPDLERNLLKGHLTRFDSHEQSARFFNFMQQFEQRAKSSGLPESEVALAYHHLNRIFQSGDSAMLTEAERMRLAEMILFHMNYPERIDQGSFPTCNVSVLEKRMYAKNPSEAVRLLADVVETGRYVTASGTVIDLSRVPQALAPDRQAARILHTRFNRNGLADLEQDNVRTWASQIFENTAANIKWMTDPKFRVNADDVILYEHTNRAQGDGRLVRYSVDGRGRRIRQELTELNRTSGKVEPISGPMVYAHDLNNIYNEITGGNDSRFVIIGPTVHASPRDIAVRTFEDFERGLAELANRRDYPAVIMVNTNNRIFGYVGGQHDWHVVNIQNTYYDFNRREWMVEYTNQWGRNNDRLGPNAVSARELFAATIGPNGVPASNFGGQSAAAASPATVSQINQNAVSSAQLRRPEVTRAIAAHNENLRRSSAAGWTELLRQAKSKDPTLLRLIPPEVLDAMPEAEVAEVRTKLTDPYQTATTIEPTDIPNNFWSKPFAMSVSA